MSRVNMPALGVGNDFVRSQPRLKPVHTATVSPALASAPAFAVLDELSLSLTPTTVTNKSVFGRSLDWLHRYSLGAFALILLIVAASGIEVGKMYVSAQYSLGAVSAESIATHKRPVKGPNLIVPSKDIDQTITNVSSQSLSLTIGAKTVPISPEKIKSWLDTSTDNSTKTAYIHVDQKAIAKTLNEAASPLIKSPLNQVSVTNADGTSKIIAAGQSGIKLGDTDAATKQIGQSLLAAKGMQITLPTETQAFAVSTVADFDKLIEVNIVTKQMYLYDHGNLSHTYPISAGATATPTPVGQYKIYEKLAVQDMRGWNANGTRYFQPHVRWVNYFLPGGYAVHGNYWRPQSWFGAVNSSHGCVSLPDTQAKEVYDWAPIGTTVITHT